MGLKSWFLKRALRKASSKSALESAADDALKDSLLELRQTSKTANKILQAKLIRQESQHALAQINELDEEFSDDEIEIQEKESTEDKMISAFLPLLMGGKSQPKNDPWADPNTPVNTSSPAPSNIAEMAKKLSPEDIDALKKQFLG